MKKKVLVASIVILCSYWLVLRIGVPFVISNKIDVIRESGYVVDYTETSVGSSPVSLAWKLSGLSIQSKDRQGDAYYLQLPDIRLDLSLLAPFNLTISSEGTFNSKQTTGGKTVHYTGIVKQFQADTSVSLNGGFDRMKSRMELSNIDLPDTVSSPLGSRVESLNVDAVIEGELMIGHLPDSLQHWVEDDGNIEIEKLTITYGPVRIVANGHIGLDQNIQPAFELQTESTGLYQAANLAVKNGYYTSRNRTEAHNFLDTLSLKGKPETGRVFELALTLHEQLLFAGEMRLAKLEKIDWQ